MKNNIGCQGNKSEIFNWGNLSKYRNEIYGFAILWIIIFHIFNSYDKINFNWTFIQICKSGNIGVDIFLLMAGICSYFSFKKSYNVKEFLKRRFIKLIKIYILFCIPFFIYRYFIISNDYNTFIHELTFTNYTFNYFWFLLCILICYVIYPIIYKFLSVKNYKPVIIGTVVYILCLFFLFTFNKPLFAKYEIGFTRIPIFVLGGGDWSISV